MSLAYSQRARDREASLNSTPWKENSSKYHPSQSTSKPGEQYCSKKNSLNHGRKVQSRSENEEFIGKDEPLPFNSYRKEQFLKPSASVLSVDISIKREVIWNSILSITADIDSLSKEVDMVISKQRYFQTSFEKQKVCQEKKYLQEETDEGTAPVLEANHTIDSINLELDTQKNLKYFSGLKEEDFTLFPVKLCPIKIFRELLRRKHFAIENEILELADIVSSFSAKSKGLLNTHFNYDSLNKLGSHWNSAVTSALDTLESKLPIIELSALKKRLKTALLNKINNQGLYHNLPKPYHPNWAANLIQEVYLPISLMQKERALLIERHDSREQEVDEHPGWVNIIKYNVSRNVDAKIKRRRLEHYFEWCDLKDEHGAHEVNEELHQKIITFSHDVEICTFPFALGIATHEAEAGIKAELEQGANEVIIETFEIFKSEEVLEWPFYKLVNSPKFLEAKAPSNSSTPYISKKSVNLKMRGILKPVSAPRVGDSEHYFTPIEVFPSPEFKKRYVKNIPRLIEFAAYAESKLGSSTICPQGY